MNGLDNQTYAHLQLADENYEFAQRLLGTEGAPQRWVAVVAFYSAVHYFGAYFWERDRTEVNSHRHRGRLLHADQAARELRGDYDRLFRLGFEARYETAFDTSADALRNLLEVELAEVRRHVISTLEN